MRGKLRDKIGSRWALALVVGVLLALAWAIPSLGASAGKVARTALVRANQAFHNANLATSNSNTAKNVSNQANATAGAANNTASAANSTANSAKTTASQALNLANGAAQVFVNVTRTIDPGNIASGGCIDFDFSQFGVSFTDEVIVTPPSTLDLGIIVQASTSSSQVTVIFCNITGAGIDPASGSYEYSVFR